MESAEKLLKFWDYLVTYPGSDEPGFDGVHDGGIKGIMESAPESAKKAYEEWRKDVERLAEQGIKL